MRGCKNLYAGDANDWFTMVYSFCKVTDFFDFNQEFFKLFLNGFISCLYLFVGPLFRIRQV